MSSYPSGKKLFSAEVRGRDAGVFRDAACVPDAASMPDVACVPDAASAMAPSLPLPADDADGVSNAEILEEIQRLSALLEARGHGAAERESPSGAPPGDEIEAAQELAGLRERVEHTKGEIALLRHPEEEEDRLMAAAQELDVIVSATEKATNEILMVAEKIEDLVEEFAAASGSPTVDQHMDQVTALVARLYEACTFQDITGQRVGKVVKTINFIEGRVASMVDIWGAEEIAAMPRGHDEHFDEEKDLLNGPQHENQGISQDEIDALFD